MKTLMESIRQHDGTFPKHEIEQIIERKEEAIPCLFEILNEVKQDPKAFFPEFRRFDHIFAIYLLAQFREKRLYPLLLDILSMPSDITDQVFGDAIEEIGRILATVYDGDGDLERLKQLVENPDAYEYARGQALNAIVTLVFNDQITRESALAYMKQLMNGKLSDMNYVLNTEIVFCCDALYPEEVLEDIKQLYERDEVESGVIDMDSINQTLKQTKEAVLQEAQKYNDYAYINDAIAELQGWACFQPNKFGDTSAFENLLLQHAKQKPVVKAETPGRNDPCSCGSGKKYKKCCGK